MKYIAVLLITLSMVLMSGCVTFVETASAEALKRMDAEQRVGYRGALDKAGEGIQYAKDYYDGNYDAEGNPLPITPVAPEPPAE